MNGDFNGFTFVPRDSRLPSIEIVALAYDDQGTVREWILREPDTGKITIDAEGRIQEKEISGDHQKVAAMASALDRFQRFIHRHENHPDRLKQQFCDVGFTLKHVVCVWAQFETATCALSAEADLSPNSSCSVVEDIRQSSACHNVPTAISMGCVEEGQDHGPSEGTDWPPSKFDACKFPDAYAPVPYLHTASPRPADTGDNTETAIARVAAPACFRGIVQADTVTGFLPTIDVQLADGSASEICVLFRPHWLREDPLVGLPLEAKDWIECTTEGAQPKKVTLNSDSETAWAVGCCMEAKGDDPPPIRLSRLGSLPGLHKGDRNGEGGEFLYETPVKGEVFVYVTVDAADHTSVEATVTLRQF